MIPNENCHFIDYTNSDEFHRAYADFLSATQQLAVDGQAADYLASLMNKCADAVQTNAFRMAVQWPVVVREVLGLSTGHTTTPENLPDRFTDACTSTDRDTIVDMLQGENLLNITRDEAGNVLMVFESAYPDKGDLLTIMPDGSVVGTFACDDANPQQ